MKQPQMSFSKFKNRFSETFEFSRQQQRGLLALSALILVLLITKTVISLIPVSSHEDFGKYMTQINEFNNHLIPVYQSGTELSSDKLFVFDPNNLPDEDWKNLGLSDRQIAVIKRYEAKGGKFFSKDDLKKMYCISPEEFARLEPYIEIEKNITDSPALSITESSGKKLNPFPFNPNGLPEEQWKLMGLTEKQVKGIKNYESKGGKFYKKEDFKKMYVIDAEEYAQLEPFIEIPVDSSGISKKSSTSRGGSGLKADAIIEINSADTSALTQIPGIGPVFASRIVKYREKLGGFHNKNQLLEVYSMDSAKFARISPFINVNAGMVRKIKINSVEFKELMKHPYFNYATVKAIFELKNKKGFISDENEIKSIPFITNDFYNKIKPYISTQN